MTAPSSRLQTRHYLTAGTLVMGLALTAVAYHTAADAEAAQRNVRVARQFATSLSLLRSTIQQHLEVLYSVRSLYQASDFVTREEFRVFVTPLLRHYPAARAIEWIPRVTREQRPAFEERGAADHIDAFHFTEADVDGEVAVAAERNVYYPVFYLEPLQNNRQVLGFDIGSNPARRAALAEAMRSDDVVVSERIQLIQEAADSSAVIALLAVPQPDADDPAGFVAGVLQPERLLKPLVGHAGRVARMTLRDVTDPREPKTLATAIADPIVPPFESRYEGESFDVGGRTWRLDSELRLAPLSPAFFSGAQGAGAFGLAITFLTILLINLGVRKNEQRLERLRRARAVREIIGAQDGERRHIAYEIHDLCGQAAIGIKLRLRTLLERVADDEALHTEISAAWRVSADIVDQLESFSRGLHPTVLDDYGLQSALARLLADARRVGGIDVAEVFQGFGNKERLPRELEATLYRVAQESVTNVLRHAGAKNLSLVCNRTATSVRLTINDDGRGFDPDEIADGGIGLRGMSERVESLGGRFSLESSHEDGTVVLVELPLPQ